MANTFEDYTVSTSTTDFNITFEYLEESHIVVEIDGVLQSTSTYSIVAGPPNLVRLNTPVTSGVVRVKRDSDADSDNPFVDFVNGSVLNETELDKAYRHNLYLNEEIGNLNELSLQKAAGSDDWDAKNNKIINVADPTLIQDASTKNYVDTQISNTITGSSDVPPKTTFTGTGSATVFTFASGITLDGDTVYEVAIDGVLQEPTAAYTIDADANTITFTSPPALSANIVVVQRGYSVPITTGTVTTELIVDGSVTADKLDSTAKDRSIFTGTQTASTISDFDTEVSNNASVAANTAKVTNATHTGDVTGSTVLTIANNVITADNISDTNTEFNYVNGGIGIGTLNETGYDLTVQKVRLKGTSTQLYFKDTDETGTPTEIAVSLNEKALRFGFQDSPSTQAFAVFGRNLTLAGGTVAEMNALTNDDGALQGQVAYVSNGNGGNPCLAMYTGTYGAGGSWKVLATPGATISA